MTAPFRFLILDALSGQALVDRIWSWPLADVPADGVAALVQSVRQLARELGVGDVVRLLIDVPLAPLPDDGDAGGGSGGGGSGAAAAGGGGGDGGGAAAAAAAAATTVVTMEAVCVAHPMSNTTAVLFGDTVHLPPDRDIAGKAVSLVERLVATCGPRMEGAISAMSGSRDAAAIATTFRATLPPTYLEQVDVTWGLAER